MPWLRRHKTIFLSFGVLIGLTLIMWAYINAPININRMQPGDWQNTHIKGIGAVTLQKLAKGAPYTDIRDVDHIGGIGAVKMAQISRYFTTWDTAKADLWFPLFLAGLVLFFGSVFVWHIIILDKREKSKRAKKLDEKLFGNKDEKR